MMGAGFGDALYAAARLAFVIAVLVALGVGFGVGYGCRAVGRRIHLNVSVSAPEPAVPAPPRGETP